MAENLNMLLASESCSNWLPWSLIWSNVRSCLTSHWLMIETWSICCCVYDICSVLLVVIELNESCHVFRRQHMLLCVWYLFSSACNNWIKSIMPCTCRPLSKTVRFNVLKVIPAGSKSGAVKKAFTGAWAKGWYNPKFWSWDFLYHNYIVVPSVCISFFFYSSVLQTSKLSVMSSVKICSECLLEIVYAVTWLPVNIHRSFVGDDYLNRVGWDFYVGHCA